VNPQQQMIMKILPAFIGLISFGLPGALVLYFVTSNLFRVGQQFLITHTIYKDDALQAGVIDADSEEKSKVDTPKLDKAKDKSKPTSSNGSGSTGTKGRATPSRGAGGSSNGKAKGSNKRTTAGRNDSNKGSSGPSLPQPRPRKKKR
jgi:YidC/Oxa1 family membrane protein insertase